MRDFEPALNRPVDGQPADPLATSGRGLQIVAAVSRDWGVRGRPDGKAVWFSLELPDAESPDADVYSMIGRGADRSAAVPSEDDGDAPDRSMQARAVN